MANVNGTGGGAQIPNNPFNRIQQQREQQAQTTRFVNAGLNVARAAGQAVTGGDPVGALLGNGANAIDGGGIGGVGQLQQLFQVQLEAQARMQQFSTQSNIAKTDHDARMTAIRNMRAS